MTSTKIKFTYVIWSGRWSFELNGKTIIYSEKKDEFFYKEHNEDYSNIRNITLPNLPKHKMDSGEIFQLMTVIDSNIELYALQAAQWELRNSLLNKDITEIEKSRSGVKMFVEVVREVQLGVSYE